MPRKRAGNACTAKTRTGCDVSATVDNRGEEKWKLCRTVAVIAIQKDDNIRCARVRDTRQTSLPVSAARFGDDSRTRTRGDLSCSIRGIVIDDDNLGDEIGGNVSDDTSDCLGLVARRNNYGDSHSISIGYHKREVGRLRAKMESIPHVRPATPTHSPSAATQGGNSSHIHEVPNSETHRLPRNANA